MVALPRAHHLLAREGNLSISSLAGEPLIIYPREPRPSYADQVISLFRDRGLEPNVVHEARELQSAVGLVAAEVGVAIVPASVQRLRRDDIVYRELAEPGISSPIIMSRRIGEHSPQLALMSRVIIEAYAAWGLPAPKGLG